MIEFMKIVSVIASPAVLSALLIAAAVIFSVQQKHVAARAAVLFLVGNAVSPIIKFVVGRPRPTDALVAEAGSAFPSSHAMSATLFACAVVFALWQQGWRGVRFWVSVLFASAFMVLVGYSRLALRVHWLSDVLGGIIIGLVWVLAIIWLRSALVSRLAKG